MKTLMPSVQKKRKLYNALVPAVFFITLLGFAVVSTVFLWKNHKNEIETQAQLSSITAHALSHHLSEYVKLQQETAKLLLSAHSSQFANWLEHPESDEARETLSKLIRQFFPHTISFTLANQVGEVLTDYPDEHLGNLCLADLMHFATANGAANMISSVHPGPQIYHYDLFVPIEHSGKHYTLLIASSLEHIIQQITTHQITNHEIFIVKESLEGDLIEMSAEGSREVMHRNYFLTDEEKSILYRDLGTRVRIENTDWWLVDLTKHQYLASLSQKFNFGLMALLLLTLILITIEVMLSVKQRTKQREYELQLFSINAQLEQKVLDRTAQIETARQQLKLAASVFDSSHEGIVITDKNNFILDVNEALIRLTGFDREELLGQSSSLFSYDQSDYNSHTSRMSALQATGFWQGEITNFATQDGSLQMLASMSVVKDAIGNITNYVCIFTDISELKANEKRLYEMANHDMLTGLPNRYCLFSQFNEMMRLSAESEQMLAVFYLDLDGFKPINDQFGHESGDLVLKTIATRIQQMLKPGDIAARFGGDEFVLVVGHLMNQSNVNTFAHDLIQRMGEVIELPTGDWAKIGASVGISLFPQHGTNPDLLLTKADQAMYSVKHQFKNAFVVHQED